MDTDEKEAWRKMVIESHMVELVTVLREAGIRVVGITGGIVSVDDSAEPPAGISTFCFLDPAALKDGRPVVIADVMGDVGAAMVDEARVMTAPRGAGEN